ncbi:MAG: hypothetical protein M3R52_00745 [Acidobacteriota bacterium]|nr:hypothetical protein [Acidobacteriota bacterium]
MGEPLPRPEHQLPSYGRSLLLVVMGALMVLTLLTQTFIALTQRSTRGAKSNLAFFSMVPFDLWSWIAAAQTAAWRLKWVMIPITILVLYCGRKLYRSIQRSPVRFCGLRYARNGYLASAFVPLAILVLIGVTVPERLRGRAGGIEAETNAYVYRYDRALDEYRETFATLPSDPKKDLRRLPDPDGSLAEALKNLDLTGYKPTADLAAVPTKKPQQLRGAVIRNASISTADDAPGERLSFTNYELPLPGPDKIMGTEDDLIVRDGVTYKASETPRRSVTTPGSIQARRP